jgi:hypothetical protein
MSNHLHGVVQILPNEVSRWSNDEIANALDALVSAAASEPGDPRRGAGP